MMNELPSKKDIIQALNIEREKNFQKVMLIIEHRKISKKMGLIVAELIQNNKLLYRGQIAAIPEGKPEEFDWNTLKVKQSKFSGFSLDYKGETVMSMVVDGLKKAVKDGRVPFLTK